MQLARATIRVIDTDAVDSKRKIPPVLDVQFNPTELTLAKGAQFAEILIPGIDSPILQFVAGQNEKLTLELFFDTTGDRGMGANARDVQELTEPFYQLVKVQPKTHAPPRVEFAWGTKILFKAVVESVQRKFTLFSPEGIPLRATLSVSFREYKSLSEQLHELNLQSADHTKKYVVCQGDTLSGIASREYGDASAWKLIAQMPDNAAKLPSLRRLRPGEVLLLPPLEAVRRAKGGV